MQNNQNYIQWIEVKLDMKNIFLFLLVVVSLMIREKYEEPLKDIKAR